MDRDVATVTQSRSSTFSRKCNDFASVIDEAPEDFRRGERLGEPDRDQDAHNALPRGEHASHMTLDRVKPQQSKKSSEVVAELNAVSHEALLPEEQGKGEDERVYWKRYE